MKIHVKHIHRHRHQLDEKPVETKQTTDPGQRKSREGDQFI